MIDAQLIKQLQKSLSKEPKIKLAYVLGSVAADRVKADSDFDLAIVVDDTFQVSYDQIYALLTPISFPKDLDLSVVDRNSSPLFLFQITSTGKCVYKKSGKYKVSFESFVMTNYYDTSHLRKIYYSYLKEKFPYAN